MSGDERGLWYRNLSDSARHEGQVAIHADENPDSFKGSKNGPPKSPSFPNVVMGSYRGGCSMFWIL